MRGIDEASVGPGDRTRRSARPADCPTSRVMTHIKQDIKPTRDAGLLAIAVFKLFKGIMLIALGLGAFRLLNPVTVHRLTDWLLHFSLTTGQRFVDKAIDLLSKLTRGHAAALGLGAIAYGSLFTVEGVGLWKGRRWAEYLTVIATSTLIPFEVYELTKRLTMVRVSALVVNVAAVIYLVYRLRHPRKTNATVAPSHVGHRTHAVSHHA